MMRAIGLMPMRALEGSDPVHSKAGGRRLPRARSFAALLGAIAAACGALAPAGARARTLAAGILACRSCEGETTQPEDSITSVSAGASNNNQVRLRIIQGGVVVNQDTHEGGAGLWQVVPPVGDTVTVESPLGTVVGAVTYDGLPSIEPTVCASSTNFSGQRSGADEVEGGFYTDEPQTNPYGEVDGYEHGHRGYAQVTLLSGAAFGGNFLVPLSSARPCGPRESLKIRRSPAWIFTYSERNRPPGRRLPGAAAATPAAGAARAAAAAGRRSPSS